MIKNIKNIKNIMRGGYVKNILLNLSVLTLVNFFLKIVNFIRNLFIATYFGSNILSDSYLFATFFPLAISGVIGGSISEACLLKFSQLLQENEKKIIPLINYIKRIIFTVSTPLVFILPLLLKYYSAKSFKNDILLFYIVVASLVPSSIIPILTSYYIVKEKFKLLGLSSLISNAIGLIISITTSAYLGILGFAIGFSFSYLMNQIILQRYLIGINDINRNETKVLFKELLIISWPIAISTVLDKATLLIDRFFAFNLIPGDLTNYYYALNLYELPIGILFMSLANILYPKLANIIKSKDDNNNIKLRKLILTIIISTIAFSVFFDIAGEKVMALLYLRGKFNYNDLVLSSKILHYLLIGFSSSCLLLILFRIFYLMNLQKMVVYLIITSLLIKFIGNYYLIPKIGIYAVSLVNSINLITITSISFIILYFNTRKKDLTFIDLKVAAAYFVSIISPILFILC